MRKTYVASFWHGRRRQAGCACRRRSFTLVEMIVALSVLGLLSVIIYDMLIGGVKAFRSEEGKTASLEYAIMAYDVISADVRRARYYGVSADCDLPPLGIRDQSVLALDCFSHLDFPSADSLPSSVNGAVFYALVKNDPAADFACLARGPRIFKSIKLSDLKFELIEADRSDGKLQRFLSIRITGYGGREKDEYTLVTLLSLDSHNLRKINPHWVENCELFTGQSHH